MRDDEIKQFLKEARDTFKQHAETINTINNNQKVIIKQVDEVVKKIDVKKEVEKIINDAKTKTEVADATAAPATPATPATPAPAAPATPPAQPAAPATPAAPAPTEPATPAAPVKPKEGE